MVDLKKLTIRESQHGSDDHGRHILHVHDPHALIQAAGYLKHRCALEGEAVYFRGQSSSYGKLSPTLFRGIANSQHTQSMRVKHVREFIEIIRIQNEIFSQINDIAHEPLLQHYGLSTTWLDLVDNIWIALWFACFKAHSAGKNSRYLHFEKRNPFVDPMAKAYILLIGTDANQTTVPGFYRGKASETIDLRIAVPSIFLRPHAQHGLLFRLKGEGTVRPVDYSRAIRGIISINLREALSWLGDAATLSVHGLFPPPLYDQGYKLLLDGAFEGRPDIGSITLVGA